MGCCIYYYLLYNTLNKYNKGLSIMRPIDSTSFKNSNNFYKQASLDAQRHLCQEIQTLDDRILAFMRDRGILSAPITPEAKVERCIAEIMPFLPKESDTKMLSERVRNVVMAALESLQSLQKIPVLGTFSPNIGKLVWDIKSSIDQKKEEDSTFSQRPRALSR